MKRVLLSALMLGVTGLFTGCGEESKVETKTTTPTGTDTKTTSEKKTGDMKDGGAAPAPAPPK
jgi:hypothetical protein